MNTFYDYEELKKIGIKAYGKNVYIGKNVIIYNPEKLIIGHDVRIDDYTILSGNINIGNYVHISHFCGLYGGDSGIKMYDYTAVSSKGTIYAVSDDYTGESMTNPMIPIKYRPKLISKEVILEKHSIIGASSVILPGVIVREGSAIGAMSLCTKSTEAWSLNIGIPAKKINNRKRDILELEEEFKKSL